MIENLTFTNFSESMYSATDVFNRTCMLNQYELIENTKRLPQLAFWFALGVFILLFIHFWITPFFKNKKYYGWLENNFAGAAFALSIWTPLILFYFTFDLSTAEMKTIENIVLYSVIALILFSIYYNRKRYIAYFKEFNKKDTEEKK